MIQLLIIDLFTFDFFIESKRYFYYQVVLISLKTFLSNPRFKARILSALLYASVMNGQLLILFPKWFSSIVLATVFRVKALHSIFSHRYCCSSQFYTNFGRYIQLFKKYTEFFDISSIGLQTRAFYIVLIILFLLGLLSSAIE